MGKHNIIHSNFVSLYDRFGVEEYDEHDKKEDAIEQLLYGADEGLCIPIAVIDIKQRKMVWFNDFIGENDCNVRVNLFLQNHTIGSQRKD